MWRETLILKALDAKWSERFNRLKTLLMARSLEPSFSADVRVPLYTHHQPLSLRTQSLSFSRLTNLWTLLLSALAQTLMLPCSCRPASFLQVLLHKVRPFPRALAQTLLLPSSSRPVSLSRIFIPRLHQGALVQTSLLVNISRPASHTPTLTDRLHRRASSASASSLMNKS